MNMFICNTCGWLVGFMACQPLLDYLKPESVFGWLVGFYGISIFVGYLTPNPFYKYILNFCDL